jgi:hypothetical protein
MTNTDHFQPEGRPPTLNLVGERKLRDLLEGQSSAKGWEASGVLARNGHFYVVFDDHSRVARIANDLQAVPANALLGKEHDFGGFEGISYNAARQRFYLLVESRKQAGAGHRAFVVECDEEFNYLKERPVDYKFACSNKGFEAIAHVERGGQDFVLALCEGNRCKCGKKGRTPGGGRVQLFEKKRKEWRHVRTIALPEAVQFEDYSGMSIDQGRVAVVSQVNSQLWVGEFNEAEWAWRDEGQLFDFPRGNDGAIRYGNVEGVSWISPTRVVTVSDRRKKQTQPDKALAEKDQSIHVFELPAGARPAGVGNS